MRFIVATSPLPRQASVSLRRSDSRYAGAWEMRNGQLARMAS